MRQNTLVGLAAVFFTSIAASACAPVSIDEEAIVGGTRGGNPSVVWILDRSSGGLCTGSLIAPRVVLTAKHCVQGPGASRTNPTALMVGTGNAAYRGRTYRVQSAYTTPGVWNEGGPTGLTGAIVGVDVGVIVLSSPADGLTPLPIFRGDPRMLRNQPFTACGFGEIPGGGAGEKYTAMGTVQGVTDGVILVGNIICSGDSGGPMIMGDGSVAGVVSFGNGRTCGTGTGAYNTLQPFLEMIDMALMEGGTCVPNGDEICDGRDNNCNGEVDEVCLPLGNECDVDGDCVGGLCANTIDGRRCTSTCDARTPAIGCEEGLYCAGAPGECGGFCVPSTGGARTGGNNTPCAGNEDCASLHCEDRGDGMRRCLTPCEAGTGACPSGEVCANTAGACGSCLSADLVNGGHQLGEPCATAAECVSGVCFSDMYPARPVRQYCSRSCAADEDCGDRFHCRDALCVAGPRGHLGDACVGSSDCTDGAFCASQGTRRWCTQTCGTCDAGFTCTDVGGTSICVPQSGLVGDGCATNADCVTGLCATSAPVDGMPGTCTRTCGPSTPCATGLECERIDGLSSVCTWPSEASAPGSSCSATSGSRQSTGALALLALTMTALIARRRRA